MNWSSGWICRAVCSHAGSQTLQPLGTCLLPCVPLNRHEDAGNTMPRPASGQAERHTHTHTDTYTRCFDSCGGTSGTVMLWHMEAWRLLKYPYQSAHLSARQWRKQNTAKRIGLRHPPSARHSAQRWRNIPVDVGEARAPRVAADLLIGRSI